MQGTGGQIRSGIGNGPDRVTKRYHGAAEFTGSHFPLAVRGLIARRFVLGEFGTTIGRLDFVQIGLDLVGVLDLRKRGGTCLHVRNDLPQTRRLHIGRKRLLFGFLVTLAIFDLGFQRFDLLCAGFVAFGGQVFCQPDKGCNRPITMGAHGLFHGALQINAGISEFLVALRRNDLAEQVLQVVGSTVGIPGQLDLRLQAGRQVTCSLLSFHPHATDGRHQFRQELGHLVRLEGTKVAGYGDLAHDLAHFGLFDTVFLECVDQLGRVTRIHFLTDGQLAKQIAVTRRLFPIHPLSNQAID